MSSKTVAKYRVYCNTDQQYVYTWSDSLPSTCPNNNQHVITQDTITIVETVSTNSVNITQENTPTGGNYRAEAKRVTVPANSTASFDYTWPYPVSVLTMTFYSSPDNDGDIINTFVAPNTVIGVATQDIDAGETILYVNPTVVANLKVGYQVNITNGVTALFLGECLAIDKINNTITLDRPLSQTVNAGTYISLTINNIKDFVLRKDTVYELARKTIGASYIPTNTIVRLHYHNNGNTEKTFFFSFETLY